MELLFLFFFLSVSVSFLCSVLESVLLSVSLSYISVLEKEKPKAGTLLKEHKLRINKSIAAILIINTIANTLGAAAVGAQASLLFGSDAVVYVSILLTFCILYFSEIIPKTIGAIYYKQLAPISAYLIRFFIWITYPIILTTLFVTDKISKEKAAAYTLSKEELLESMWLSEDGGVIDEKESEVIENILNLDNIRVGDVLTPRSVVFALDESMSINEVVQTQSDIFKFSRIPVYATSLENVTGIVLTKKIFEQMLQDATVPLHAIKKELFRINEKVPVSKALDLFIAKKEHMFLVTDSYDQVEGIITLEDCIETVLGVEIVDESDTTVDMRELAKINMRLRRKTGESVS
ncbi:MAG: CNNM domain-containing protein [Sulfurimonadaceae bacterium]